jgi:hypothetical protein
MNALAKRFETKMGERTVAFHDSADQAVRDAESQLDAAGTPIPFWSRAAWGAHSGSVSGETAIVTGQDGQADGVLACEASRCRSLPGHHTLRIRAVGDSYDACAGNALLRAMALYVRQRQRLLWAVVELECVDGAARKRLQGILTDGGFRPKPAEQIPERTVIVDLRPSADTVYGLFSRNARYKIGKSERLGIAVQPLVAASFCDRMGAMLGETFARTGAHVNAVNWLGALKASATSPGHSRIFGVFRGPSRGPEDLLAFAWGVIHGERAVYHMGASVRTPGENVPLLYPALWQLMQWSKENGASWFDLGGVSSGGGGGDDPLERISEFKRRFSKTEISLGEEWILEPNMVKSSIARFVSGAANRALRLPRSRHFLAR